MVARDLTNVSILIIVIRMTCGKAFWDKVAPTTGEGEKRARSGVQFGRVRQKKSPARGACERGKGCCFRGD